MGNAVLFLCIILWGLSTFLNRLSVENLPPLMMQVVVGMVFLVYMPIAMKISGVTNPLNYNWNYTSIGLTVLATIFSIGANVMLYMFLKGSTTTGCSTMIVSLYPIVTLMLSYFFLNEQITFLKLGGVVAMMLGAIILSL